MKSFLNSPSRPPSRGLSRALEVPGQACDGEDRQ